MMSARRALGWVLVAMTLMAVAGSSALLAEAVEVGQPAPDFRLASTRGVDVALSEFRGRKWVFLEFYGGDFHPT